MKDDIEEVESRPLHAHSLRKSGENPGGTDDRFRSG